VLGLDAPALPDGRFLRIKRGSRPAVNPPARSSRERWVEASLREVLSADVTWNRCDRRDICGAMERPLAEGDEVDGKYVIVRHLGSGGMGHVYEADDRSLRRRVALKVLPSALQLDATARERLLREGRAVACVSHPGVVRVYEVGSDGCTDYVAMELLHGEDLYSRLQREGRQPVAFVEHVAEALVDAMAAMHEAGIVHRDLKPRNIFLAQEGNSHDVLKILDFGVAKSQLVQMGTLTETGQVFGTLHYMAPEQLRGAKNADARSDIWSAGAILYEALTGRLPFEAESGPELVYKVATGDPIPVAQIRPDVSESLAVVIARCLQRDPSARFQSARTALTCRVQRYTRSSLCPRLWIWARHPRCGPPVIPEERACEGRSSLRACS
jgi:serine/threonine protein kinase